MGKHRAPAVAPLGVSLLDHMLSLLAAADLRYQQRFDAQERALQAALLAQEKAVAAALLAQQTAVAAAQSAADRATTKAENAAERRFESVNEFRAQLTDQAATFMPRVEAEARMVTLTEKIDDQRKTIDALREMAVAVGGRSAGLNSGWSYLIAAVGAVGVIVAIFVALH